ncbi:alpha/beta hydrolase, partial [Mycobacteroides abscessus subsp. abscessus]
MTTADGRALHYQVAGSGEPTVVFESGMGFSRTAWGLVQPL